MVLSEDLFRGSPEVILKAKVLLTVMDGRVVHRVAPFETLSLAPGSRLSPGPRAVAPAGPS